jgi:hypothetical protein
LAAVVDLFSRQVVGWSMQPHMQASLVSDALRMAWFRRHPQPGLIFHSDRGSQYCSDVFQDALGSYGMRSSMSRKGNCWDNAPTESLWGSLKVGRLYGKRFATQREAMDEVIDWLTFYNHRRLHSTLGYISPMKYEKIGTRARPRKPCNRVAMHYVEQGQGQRRLAGSSFTSSTAHGGCKPSALVNSASIPTFTASSHSSKAAPWTYGQAAMRPAHMPTGLDYEQLL